MGEDRAGISRRRLLKVAAAGGAAAWAAPAIVSIDRAGAQGTPRACTTCDDPPQPCATACSCLVAFTADGPRCRCSRWEKCGDGLPPDPTFGCPPGLDPTLVPCTPNVVCTPAC